MAFVAHSNDRTPKLFNRLIISFLFFIDFFSLWFCFASMYFLKLILESLIFSIEIYVCMSMSVSVISIRFVDLLRFHIFVEYRMIVGVGVGVGANVCAAFSCRWHFCRLYFCFCCAILISIAHRITLLLQTFYFFEFSINVNRFACWFLTVWIQRLKYFDVLMWTQYNT